MKLFLLLFLLFCLHCKAATLPSNNEIFCLTSIDESTYSSALILNAENRLGNPILHLPQQIVKSGVTINIIYDGRGNKLAETLSMRATYAYYPFGMKDKALAISLTNPKGMYPELEYDDYDVWGAQLTRGIRRGIGEQSTIPPGAGLQPVNDSDGRFQHLEVIATVYTYGPASSAEVAARIEQDVSNVWNGTQTGSAVSGRSDAAKVTPVVFNINFVHVSVEKALALAAVNKDSTVNFIKILASEGTDASFMFGNSGVLNLVQHASTGQTTAAHEIGHMMGFRNPMRDGVTHFIDEDLTIPLISGQELPIMYPGGEFINQKSQRVRTTDDMQGLGIANWFEKNQTYIGETMTNVIYNY